MNGTRSKITFLAIGGINTLFSTMCFYVLDYLINPSGAKNPFIDDVALALSLLLATPFSYVMQRRFVFRPQEAAGVREFLRFASVSGSMYAINLFVLPLLTWLFNHLHHGRSVLAGVYVSNAVVAQVIITFSVAVMSWFSHSRFSFKDATVQAAH